MSFSNITNIYELLDQEGEEGVARLPAKKEVAAPKPAAPFATKTASPAVKSGQQSSFNKTQSPKGERRNDRPRDNNRDNTNRPPRQDRPRPQQQGDQQGETERQPVENARRDRPVDRNNAQDKGASRNDEYRRNAATGSAGGFVGNKRVFDRKSQTNRGDGQGRENKRGGRGKNNWGPDDGSDIVNQAIKDVAKQTGDNIVQGEGVADNKGTDAVAEKLEDAPKVETEEEKADREKREKEEKQVSWSDYQKQLAEKKAQQALPSSSAERKANEGVDEKTAKKWSSYEQVKRDDVVSAKTEEKKSAGEKVDEKAAAKKKTVRLDELFKIKESPKPVYTEERRDRDGKKGGKFDNKNKGSGNKGKQPSGQQSTQQQGPEVSFDANSFPVLQ